MVMEHILMHIYISTNIKYSPILDSTSSTHTKLTIKNKAKGVLQPDVIF